MSSSVYIGIAHLDLHIPDARSLKAKRSPVRSLVEKIRSRHQVLVIEVDGQSLYQRARLAICAMSSNATDIESRLQRVANTVEKNWSGHVLSWEVDVAKYD